MRKARGFEKEELRCRRADHNGSHRFVRSPTALAAPYVGNLQTFKGTSAKFAASSNYCGTSSWMVGPVAPDKIQTGVPS